MTIKEKWVTTSTNGGTNVDNGRGDSGEKLKWQLGLIRQFDEMVDSFLGFPDSVPKSFQDYQFARHTIWRLMDNQKHFRRLFLAKVAPNKMNHFWCRLLPYITGTMPGEVSNLDPVVIKLSLAMYELTKDATVTHQSNLDQLMDQMVKMMRELRAIIQQQDKEDL